MKFRERNKYEREKMLEMYDKLDAKFVANTLTEIQHEVWCYLWQYTAGECYQNYEYDKIICEGKIQS